MKCKEYYLAKDLIDWKANAETPKYEWKYIDQGSFRSVFLGPDQMVYKLPLYFDDEDCFVVNDDEFKNWQKIKQLPAFRPNWMIAESVQLFEFPHIGHFDGWHANVIQMTYYAGRKLTKCEDSCGYDLANCIEFNQANAYYDMWDINSDNVIVLEDQTRVIVDLQN